VTPGILDIAVLVIVLVSGILAFARGLVREVLSIGAWVGAAIATLYLFRFAQPIAHTYIKIDLAADIAAGVAIFVATLIILSVISHALSRRVRESALGPLDRSLGLAFGLVRGVALLALAFLIYTALFPAGERPKWITEARTEPVLAKSAEILAQMLPERWVAKSVDAADAAKRGADQAIETGKAVEPLAAPLFKTPTNEAAKPADSGYKDDERKDLNRLIESNQ
jgi:membrane protein required for colicin V production